MRNSISSHQKRLYSSKFTILNHHHTSINIDLDSLEHNLKQIKAFAPRKRIMGIVKKNAYGHGLVGISLALEKFGINYLGVIYPEEGLKLRQSGIKTPILVLGAMLPADIPICIEHDLELALLSESHLVQIQQAAKQIGKKAKVHLKVDTGMGRIGIAWHASERLIHKVSQADTVEVKGIFTHLACADLPKNSFTQTQITRFETVVKQFEDLNGWRPLIHMAASGGILYYPDTHFDMVRPGHLLYGVLPDTAYQPNIDLKPILSLHTRIVFSKKIKKGETVGYGNKWIAPYDTHIATLPLGYGDGYSRKLTGKGVNLIVNDQLFPIVGSICMDQMMIDTGETFLEVGTKAIAIGKHNKHQIHPHSLADLQETVPDDVLSGLNWNIPRIFS